MADYLAALNIAAMAAVKQSVVADLIFSYKASNGLQFDIDLTLELY